MNTSQDQGFNLNKTEWIITSIVILTALYVIGVFAYPHAKKPSYTDSFKIVSKEFIPKRESRHISYSRSGRYGAFLPLTTYVPAHYRVNIQWGEESYPLRVPLEKSYLLKHEKITFTYRITKDGWLRLLDFHDTNGHVDTAEILEF